MQVCYLKKFICRFEQMQKNAKSEIITEIATNSEMLKKFIDEM